MAPPTDYFGHATEEGVDILDALAGVWMAPGAVTGWTRIRVRFDRELTLPECWRVAACVGYAMRELVRSRVSFLMDRYATLENPRFDTETLAGGAVVSVLYFDYDSSHSERGDPLAASVEAFGRAGEYVVDGSPIRKTDRQGQHTAGTRLCEGIGQVGVTFHVHKAYDDGSDEESEPA